MDTSKLPTYLLVNTRANFIELMCLYSGCVKAKTLTPEAQTSKLKHHTQTQSPNTIHTPKPQSPNPNPQSPKIFENTCPNQPSRTGNSSTRDARTSSR